MKWILVRDIQFVSHFIPKGTILEEHPYQNYSYFEKKEVKSVEKSRFNEYKYIILFDHTKDNKKRYFAIGKDVKRFKEPRFKREFIIKG